MRATIFAICFVVFSAVPLATAQAPQAPSSVIAAIHASGSRIYNEAQIAASAGLNTARRHSERSEESLFVL